MQQNIVHFLDEYECLSVRNRCVQKTVELTCIGAFICTNCEEVDSKFGSHCLRKDKKKVDYYLDSDASLRLLPVYWLCLGLFTSISPFVTKMSLVL